MTIKAPYYPIIYVRGYAATMGEIEETVATPYMGFNLGATKIRQDYRGDVVRFIFESPLIRLMKDEGYQDTYLDGDVIPFGQKVPAKSVWIFRYYEPVSEDLGEGERRTIPRFAAELRKFILRVREQVCGNSKTEQKKFKVYLVAHSMGGLICRCYLQNICKKGAMDAFEGEADADVAEVDKLLELPGDHLVDKVFTYATPHNGIEMAGINVPNLGALDRLHVHNFNRKHMRTYLRNENEDVPVNSLDGAFPEERFFCLVGTNYRDYSAFFGLSKKGTGPTSDGLVMMKNASVEGAPRAFVHRSHSGHYGIVNSEEGYQNLRRFLFGDIRVRVSLAVDQITLPQDIVKKVRGNLERVKAAYNIEASAALRGLNVFLNERRVAQESAIRRTYERLVHSDKPIYLFSGYLLESAKTKPSKKEPLVFSLDIGIEVPVYEVDRRFWLDDHVEGGFLYRGAVTLRVDRSTSPPTVTYDLEALSTARVVNEEVKPLETSKEGELLFELPLGFEEGTANPPRPGFRGRLLLKASAWNTA